MVLIKNKSKKVILSSKAVMCGTLTSKFWGLMFSAKPRTLIFKFNRNHRISLHMFFVFFPIDVLFLDKNKKVVDTKENFRPFTLYASKKKALYAIELPKGTVKRTKTKLHDSITFADA